MQEYCAQVRFQPPLAAEPPSTGARGAEAQAGSASKRKRSGAATAAADAAAAAARGYDIHVDGNVVELPPGFRCVVIFSGVCTAHRPLTPLTLQPAL